MRSYQEEVKVVQGKVEAQREGAGEEGDMFVEVEGFGKEWKGLDWEANWLRSQIRDDPGRLLWT